jgi:hypothetical protein
VAQYIVDIEWSGYSRGTQQLLVNADNEEQVRERDWDWETEEELKNITVRDDTEKEIVSVRKVDE